MAAQAINEARRPVVYAGGGIIISGAHQELKELAEKANLPVTLTLMGLGGFPGTHPLFMGMLGMHGTFTANYAVQECDLLIAIGARFDDRVTGKVEAFAPHARIIHIDIDPASISKNVRVDIPVVGDARSILSELLPLVEEKERAEWNARVADWKKQHPLTFKKEGLKPQYVVQQIYEVTKGDAIICTEVGQNQMWAAQYYLYDMPRRFVSSGGLGTMGYGFPAAIGAQVGRPDAVVFDIAGDGSIQMNIQELATAVINRLPVNIAILNNGYLGMVRQWQELFFKRRYSHTTLTGNPDFAKVAEAYGAVGITVTRAEDVKAALEQAIATPAPVVLDFHVAPEENVFPMVPASEALDRMIGGMA
jgi:acetolactate synthase-1/2/3 large subunit